MDESSIPEGFLRADIETRGKRHLISATEEQLTLLNKAKRWFVDGTFKLCRPPFTQLFTINAFVRQDDHAKQVPLLFVLMSSNGKHDYKKVLKKVLRILPTTPSVEHVTADFNSAVWGAASGSVVTGVCLPLEPGPLEKSSKARLSDCVYERPGYEWLHQATDGTTLPSAWDHCCNLRQPKTRSQNGAFTAVRQLHRGKLDSQHSLTSQVLERIYAINQNKQWHVCTCLWPYCTKKRD